MRIDPKCSQSIVLSQFPHLRSLQKSQDARNPACNSESVDSSNRRIIVIIVLLKHYDLHFIHATETYRSEVLHNFKFDCRLAWSSETVSGMKTSNLRWTVFHLYNLKKRWSLITIQWESSLVQTIAYADEHWWKPILHTSYSWLLFILVTGWRQM